MSLHPYHDQFCRFLLEAGTYAKEHQAGVKTSYKAGEQAVTETDLYVSKLAHERLRPILSQQGFILVDEESIGNAGSPESVFQNKDDLIILDPIDGTAGYAVGRGYWGVMLAHWHKGAPVWGGIYLPVQRTALITDAEGVVCLFDPAGKEERTTRLSAKPMAINSQTYIEVQRTDHLAADKYFMDQKAWFNTPESAAQAAFSVIQGHSAAAVVSTVFSIWDLAAAVALAQVAGFAVCDLRSGEDKKTFTANDFFENWKSKKQYMICHPSNKDMVRNLFAEESARSTQREA